MKNFLLLLFWTLILGGANAGTLAQTPPTPAITVTHNEAVLDFPQSVTFRLDVQTARPLTAATLHYSTNRLSCLPTQTQVPVTPTGSSLEWQWVLSRSGSPPPGAQLSWFWTLEDTSGSAIATPLQSLTFNDPRYDWRQVSADGIHVNWYRGDHVGPELLQAALAALERLQLEMGIQLEQDVQFFIYGSADDMRDAVLYVQDWAGALAFSDYNIILIGVSPAQLESWGKPTAAHELAHLVVGQFGWSCVGGSRPTWLEEGLAMVAEGEPSEAVRQDIARGVEDDLFVPVRSLNGAFSAHSADAGIAYSQSYSLVSFLLDTYGQQAMQQLLRALADGAVYDEALEEVYGFNTDGLETAWRVAIGAPPRQIPPTPTPINPVLIPTALPLQVARSQPTPPAAAAPPPESDGSSLCPAAFIPPAALLLLLAAPRRRQKLLIKKGGSLANDETAAYSG